MQTNQKKAISISSTVLLDDRMMENYVTEALDSPRQDLHI